MKNQNEQIRKAMKVIGKVTLDTLPDILNLIPVIGIPLGTGAKILIGGVGENQEINQVNRIDQQIRELYEAINKNLISENQIITTIKSQVLNLIRDENEKKQVYMFGISLYSFNNEEISEGIKVELREVFSGEYEYKGKYKDLAERISDFISAYLVGNGSMNEGDEYYFLDDALIINFWTDYDYYIRNDQDILDFIYALNEIISEVTFFEYVVF